LHQVCEKKYSLKRKENAPLVTSLFFFGVEIAEHQPYDKSVDCWAAGTERITSVWKRFYYLLCSLSKGVIMYTVMCGYPPFWASTPEKLLELVAQVQRKIKQRRERMKQEKTREREGEMSPQ
jgi:hypothetical protein